MKESLEYILNDVKKWKGFSLKKKINFRMFNTETFGYKPIYKVEGDFLYTAKTRYLSSKPARRSFWAKVDAKDGKVLVFNWQPEEIL